MQMLDCIETRSEDELTSMQPHNPIEHVVIIVKENHGFDIISGPSPA